jgi:hypothetical protein
MRKGNAGATIVFLVPKLLLGTTLSPQAPLGDLRINKLLKNFRQAPRPALPIIAVF